MEFEMVKCLICEKEFKSLKAISSHVCIHNITSEQYYEKYLKKENDGICLNHGIIKSCKRDTKWINMIVGYHKYCSVFCYTQTNEFKKIASESKKGDKHWLKRFVHPNKGKTYEEIHGKEKSLKLKKVLSEIGKQLKGNKNPFFNHTHNEKNKEIFRKNKKGKTYVEMYGSKKSKEIKLKQSKPQKKPWNNEGLYTKKFYNKEFRQQILIEQKDLCGSCNLKLFKKHKQLHHINFEKTDDNRENLIYLCPTCHGKTKNRTIFKETIEFLKNRNKMIINNYYKEKTE